MRPQDLTLVALGGEVVVGYDLAVKKEFGSKGMIVAGYCNDVMAYIPTLEILKEGGHEGVGCMVPYGQPGPWDQDIEQKIQTTIRQVLKQVGRLPQQ